MVEIVGHRNCRHKLLLTVGVEAFAPMNGAVRWG